MGTLAEFLMSGTLAGLSLGTDQATVQSRLGAPLQRSTGRSELWKYGPLEIGFEPYGPRNVRSICLYFREPGDPPNGLNWQGWWPSFPSSSDDFLARMSADGVTLSESEIGGNGFLAANPDGPQVMVDDCRVDSIQSVAVTRSTRRQLTVSLPGNVIDLVRTKAASRQQSVADYCAAVLLQSVAD